ncbi:MAG TPA: hypothetical protein VFU76_01855 [Terriglobales bacterium]|nr:hypothetical protein [Terriglobales bacterium]
MRSLSRIAAALVFLVCAVPAFTAEKPVPGPKYDLATETVVKGAIIELKEVEANKGDIHLMVKSGDTVYEVCLCPQKFLNELEIQYKVGDELQVTGSKVKDGEREVLLAREIVRGESTLTLRDKKGNPVWTFLVK